MKKKRPPLLAALSAASFSFLGFIFSFLCSNFFQKIFDINKYFYFIFDYYPEVLEKYTYIQKFIFGTLIDKLSEEFSCPSFTVPLVFLVLVWFSQSGLKKIFDISVEQLYETLLLEPHPIFNLVGLSKRILILFWLNLISFCFYWYIKDFPPMICNSASIVFVYVFGILYTRKYKKWCEEIYVKNYEKIHN